jgi:hypothetical protein
MDFKKQNKKKKANLFLSKAMKKLKGLSPAESKIQKRLIMKEYWKIRKGL